MSADEQWTANTMPTTVVMKIMRVNTMPIAFKSPQALPICMVNTPMINTTINARNQGERKNAGMGLFGENLAMTES